MEKPSFTTFVHHTNVTVCDCHSLLHLSDIGYEAMQTLKILPSSLVESVTVVITILATMGLTFTKTQWICVTHTYKSIHKITRLCHTSSLSVSPHCSMKMLPCGPQLPVIEDVLMYVNTYFLQVKISKN